PLEDLVSEYDIVPGHRLTVMERNSGSDVDIDNGLGCWRCDDKRVTGSARSLRGIRQDRENDIVRCTRKQTFETPFDLVCIPDRVRLRIEEVHRGHVVLYPDNKFRSLRLRGSALCKENESRTEHDEHDGGRAQTRRTQKLQFHCNPTLPKKGLVAAKGSHRIKTFFQRVS